MNEYCMAALRSEFQGDSLAHHGIIGQRWGIRRFQPYGQGYDADHQGREVGLAARLGGSGGSFSSTYGRGRSKGSLVERAKSAASKFGKKAYDASQEAADRLNYGLDRASKKAKAAAQDAAKRAKSGLARYASSTDTGRGIVRDDDAQRAYESAGIGSLAKGVLSRFGSDAKRKISDIRSAGTEGFREGMRSALGTGYSKFQGALQTTSTKSKEFARNAKATASVLSGVFDPTGSRAGKTLSDMYTQPDSHKRHGRSSLDDPLAPGREYSWLTRDIEGLNGPKARPSSELRTGIRAAGGKLMAPKVLSAIDQQTSRKPRWSETPGSETSRGVAAATRQITDLQGRTVYPAKPYSRGNQGQDITPSGWAQKRERYQYLVDTGRRDKLLSDTDYTGFKTPSEVSDIAKRRGVSLAPISQISSSSSADIGRRLLGF